MTPIPTPDNKGQLGGLAYHLHETVMRHPQHHTRVVSDSVRKGQPKSQNFHLCQLVKSPIHTPHHNVSGDYMRNLEFSPHPA